MNIVITGAGRGLGLGFVRHYLTQGEKIWATFRTPSADLDALQTRYPQQLHLLAWDITAPCPDLKALPPAIDLLINNAGIYGPGKEGQSLERITAETMQTLFAVDCVAPLMVVQQLRTSIEAAGGTIANISSKMGSISDNSSGGTYAYRAAKSALVMVSKSMAVDLTASGVHVITLHPGWVRTDMTHHTGLIDISESVSGMAKVLARARDFAGGSFITYDGQPIPY